MVLLEKELKILANRRRLLILKFLEKEKEATVGNVALHIKLSFKSTSKHLALLRAVDMVEREQKELEMFYKLSGNPSRLLKFVLSLF